MYPATTLVAGGRVRRVGGLDCLVLDLAEYQTYRGSMVDATHDPQLLKGLLSFVLLHLLAEQESYGYEVVSRLHQEGIEVLEGTVYPALSRLERDGHLSSRLVASHSGPARKYYRPTPAGYAELTRGTSNWRTLTQTIGSVLDRPVPDQPQEGS
jgi:PadR family transcriptional regulator PadR